MSRATMRKNGLRMFTLSVRFNVGRDHLVEAVTENLGDETAPPRTRTEVMKMVREALFSFGHRASYRHHVDESVDLKAQYEQACEIVDRLFPELRES